MHAAGWGDFYEYCKESLQNIQPIKDVKKSIDLLCLVAFPPSVSDYSRLIFCSARETVEEARKSILGFMTAQLPDPGVYRQPTPCGKRAGLRTEPLIFRTFEKRRYLDAVL